LPTCVRSLVCAVAAAPQLAVELLQRLGRTWAPGSSAAGRRAPGKCRCGSGSRSSPGCLPRPRAAAATGRPRPASQSRPGIPATSAGAARAASRRDQPVTARAGREPARSPRCASRPPQAMIRPDPTPIRYLPCRPDKPAKEPPRITTTRSAAELGIRRDILRCATPSALTSGQPCAGPRSAAGLARLEVGRSRQAQGPALVSRGRRARGIRCASRW